MFIISIETLLKYSQSHGSCMLYIAKIHRERYIICCLNISM